MMIIYLFIFVLFKNSVSSSGYITSDDRTINELVRIWKNLSWPNFRYCPGNFLEELRKTTTNLSQDRQSQAEIRIRDLPNKKQEW
jgi:hypothetical protein